MYCVKINRNKIISPKTGRVLKSIVFSELQEMHTQLT